MKDILAKLSELSKEVAAPTRKQRLLTEDSVAPPTKAETKPSRLRDIFEAMAVGQKPLPVLDKENGKQQTGAGFLNITDNSPSSKAIQKAVGDLAATGKAQIVVPNQQAGTTGGTANNRMSGAGASNPNALKPSIGSTQVQEAGKGGMHDGTWEEDVAEYGYSYGKTVNGRKLMVTWSDDYEPLNAYIDGKHVASSKTDKHTDAEHRALQKYLLALANKEKNPIKKGPIQEDTGSTYEKGHRLFEISEEISALVDEAYALTRGTTEEGRAHSYWYPHIKMAIDHNHGYMGRNMFTMAQSAEALMGNEDAHDSREWDSYDEEEEEEEDIHEGDIPPVQPDFGAGLGAGRSKNTFENKNAKKDPKKDAKKDVKAEKSDKKEKSNDKR